MIELAVFLLAQSENSDLVQYSVQLDDSCAPSAVRASWKYREPQNGKFTAELSEPWSRALGIISEQLFAQNSRSSIVRIVIAHAPSKSIDVRTWRNDDGTCSASAHSTIDGAWSRVYGGFVQLRKVKKGYRVRWTMLEGYTEDDRNVHEKVK